MWDEEILDEEFESEDSKSLRFMNWYADLEMIAKKFGINVSDRDAWEEAFETGLSPRDVLAEDHPYINEPAKANVHPLTAEVVATAIGLPLSKWPGQCYGVACAILDAGLIQGRPVYGHYLGAVVPGTLFAGRGLIQHGWIETPEGEVVDPTRWVFENDEPYLYRTKLSATRDYDEGGNRYRLQNEKPAPDFKDGEESFVLSDEAMPVVNGLLQRDLALNTVCFSQLFWLANLSLFSLNEHAKLVYQELDRHNQLCLVPLDNKLKVIGSQFA